MTDGAACFSLIRSELNEFLFASIGLERNGMMLSVISGLARLGVDPWEEAARLANLPGPAATDALARAIASMSGGCWQAGEARPIATRLILLLPKHGRAAPPVAARSNTLLAAYRRIPVALVWVLLGALVIVTIANNRALIFGGDREATTFSADPRP
jgi:hypothetical protein